MVYVVRIMYIREWDPKESEVYAKYKLNTVQKN